MPASRDIDGIKGLELRLAVGPNVVTLIVPRAGLVGVAQSQLGVEEGLRSVEGIQPYVERLGLQIASRKSYLRWIDAERDLNLADHN